MSVPSPLPNITRIFILRELGGPDLVDLRNMSVLFMYIAYNFVRDISLIYFALLTYLHLFTFSFSLTCFDVF